jgi:hypothetical protein
LAARQILEPVGYFRVENLGASDAFGVRLPCVGR